MLRQTFFALTFILSSCALAAGLPTSIEVTPKNAEAYSIELKQISSGSPSTDLYQLEFSDKLEECSAGRVQTALFSGENEISSSSMDYKVGSSQPSLLIHMPAAGYDMAITLQYCCAAGLSPGCKRSLSIKSVKDFVTE